MQNAIIIIALVSCLCFVGGVSAEYQAENPYNEIWYSSEMPYFEKLMTFNDLISAEERVKYMELSDKGRDIQMKAEYENDPTEYHRLNRLYVDVCRGLEDVSLISDIDMYYLDSIYQTGGLSGALEYQTLINESFDAYCQWIKTESDIERDVVPAGAEFLPLPAKLVVNPDRSYVNSLPARERVVEKIVEKVVPVEVVKEVPVEVVKEIETIVPVERVVEVEVPVIKEVEVVKEVPVIQEVAVPEYHTYYVDVPVEVEKVVEVEKIVEVPVEVVKEVEVEKIVYRNFWDSLCEWWGGLFS